MSLNPPEVDYHNYTLKDLRDTLQRPAALAILPAPRPEEETPGIYTEEQCGTQLSLIAIDIQAVLYAFPAGIGNETAPNLEAVSLISKIFQSLPPSKPFQQIPPFRQSPAQAIP